MVSVQSWTLFTGSLSKCFINLEIQNLNSRQSMNIFLFLRSRSNRVNGSNILAVFDTSSFDRWVRHDNLHIRMILLLCFRFLQLFFYHVVFIWQVSPQYPFSAYSIIVFSKFPRHDHRISITFLDINKFLDILSNHFLREISIKIDELRYYVVSHTFTVYLFALFRFPSRVKMFSGCIVIKCPRICANTRQLCRELWWRSLSSSKDTEFWGIPVASYNSSVLHLFDSERVCVLIIRNVNNVVSVWTVKWSSPFTALGWFRFSNIQKWNYVLYVWYQTRVHHIISCITDTLTGMCFHNWP